MNQSTTFILDPEKTYNELEKASKEKAEKIYKARLSEKKEKPLLAMLKAKVRLNREKISNLDCLDEAYKSDEYAKWIQEDAEAVKEKSLAVDRYNNLNSFKDMRITEESSARYLINKKM